MVFLVLRITRLFAHSVKSGKPGLKTRKVWLVQPGLHPGKPWFNQAFGARAECGREADSIRVWLVGDQAKNKNLKTKIAILVYNY